MKKYRKLLTTALCAAALVGASILGTMAYFTDNEAVVNTFTVGNVDITLDEAKVNKDGEVATGTDAGRVQANEYHLIPGHVYTKDPTVTVDAKSEDCYVRMFLTINKQNELDVIFDTINTARKAKEQTPISIIDVFGGYDSTKWALVKETENSTDNSRTYEFRYIGTTTGVVAKNDSDTVLPALFTTIQAPGEMTKEQLAQLYTEGATDNFEIEVTAQAIQADGFDTAEGAWGEFPTN